MLDKHGTSGHPVPALFTRRIPEYRVVVDETKEIATAGDARRLELLLNTCSELCGGYADRNHEKGNKYFYRLQDNLIALADDELGMCIEKLNDHDHNPTAPRFSCVPSMFESSGVKVPYPTRWR